MVLKCRNLLFALAPQLIINLQGPQKFGFLIDLVSPYSSQFSTQLVCAGNKFRLPEQLVHSFDFLPSQPPQVGSHFLQPLELLSPKVPSGHLLTHLAVLGSRKGAESGHLMQVFVVVEAIAQVSDIKSF